MEEEKASKLSSVGKLDHMRSPEASSLEHNSFQTESFAGCKNVAMAKVGLGAYDMTERMAYVAVSGRRYWVNITHCLHHSTPGWGSYLCRQSGGA